MMSVKSYHTQIRELLKEGEPKDQIRLFKWVFEHYDLTGNRPLLIQSIESCPSIATLKDTNGATLLCSAAARDDALAIEFLLPYSKVNDCDQEGSTALMYAAINNRSTALNALLKDPNLNLNKKDDAGATALFLAAKFQAEECLGSLLNQGANADLTDITGRTVLGAYCSEWFGFHDTPEHLSKLANLSDVNYVDPASGFNPLMMCIHKGSLHAVTMLLPMTDLELDIPKPLRYKKEYKNAIEFTQWLGHTQLAEMLLRERDRQRSMREQIILEETLPSLASKRLIKTSL